MLRKLSENVEDYHISSAGLAASEGSPASRHSRQVAHTKGLDLDLHRSKQLTDEIVAQSSHLFALSTFHFQSIIHQFPEAEPKTYLISEFCQDDAWRNLDVSDPFGQSLTDYHRMANQLEKYLPSILAFSLHSKK
jgi:protein-tyrosine phosphatase